jgi:hypothetical protein
METNVWKSKGGVFISSFTPSHHSLSKCLGVETLDCCWQLVQTKTYIVHKSSQDNEIYNALVLQNEPPAWPLDVIVTVVPEIHHQLILMVTQEAHSARQIRYLFFRLDRLRRMVVNEIAQRIIPGVGNGKCK